VGYSNKFLSREAHNDVRMQREDKNCMRKNESYRDFVVDGREKKWSNEFTRDKAWEMRLGFWLPDVQLGCTLVSATICRDFLGVFWRFQSCSPLEAVLGSNQDLLFKSGNAHRLFCKSH